MLKMLFSTLGGAFDVTVSAIWKIAFTIALIILGLVFLAIGTIALTVHIVH